MLQFASILAFPVTPTLVQQDSKTTWRLASDDLTNIISLAWEMLDPTSEQVLHNIEMLPQVSNSFFPYRSIGSGEQSLYVSDVPPNLAPKQKLNAADVIPCFICGKQFRLPMMRNHVGGHVIRSQRQSPDPTATVAVGPEPCGFCGREGCYTQLTKSGLSFKVTSQCDYHYSTMQYKAAAKFSANAPCTNVPIHCALCPTSASGTPRTIWKYNAIYHLISEHGDENQQIPSIPGQFMVDMFVHRREEAAMGFTAQETAEYRQQNQIPDSDAIDAIAESNEVGKRGRSNTQSTTGSDSHVSKQGRIA
ncbi:hypothetical protein FB45DRAFT_761958 [Roridomyces roridus]|uniref:Uncharacterized protein n=1 Tax=Roridomyces roridus TaxID=1738132 RepID=A0AAD7F8Z6_9AGAR|nr:hypothetical protein FB45DRAFT_761958 [Roridomyces roridus]